MKKTCLFSLLALFAAGEAFAGACALTGPDRVGGEIVIGGIKMTLPTSLEQCTGVVGSGEANLIFRNQGNDNQIVHVRSGDDLGQVTRTGKATSQGLWKNVVALLQGDIGTAHGSKRMGEDDKSGFPNSTVLLTGSDIVFDARIAGMVGSPLGLKLEAEGARPILLKASGPTVTLPRKLLKPDTEYRWTLATSANESAEGHLATLSAEDETEAEKQLRAIDARQSSAFEKQLGAYFVYDNYGLAYDKAVLIRSLKK